MKKLLVAAEVTRPKSFAHGVRLVTSAATLLVTAALFAQDYAYEKSAKQNEPTVTVPLTAEEKTQLAALDVRLAAVEALVPKIEEPGFKASTLSAIADIKRRRAALDKKFDPASYETLMHTVIGRYQVVSLWLKPPRIPAASSGSS